MIADYDNLDGEDNVSAFLRLYRSLLVDHLPREDVSKCAAEAIGASCGSQPEEVLSRLLTCVPDDRETRLRFVAGLLGLLLQIQKVVDEDSLPMQ